MVLNISLQNNLRAKVNWQWENLILCIHSLFGNCHLDRNYASDVLMEPVLWIVDNFTKFLGPFFVVCVVLIMLAVITIAYCIGLPYYWNKNPQLTVGLVIFGNWLKWNTLFHYYMGVVTSPGYPPKGGMIQEAVSICRKCISPKPPRTHHCSICNRCILKMDHHCPWLNNCVGHYNHRYFYMYIVFISLSTLFLMIFGYEIAYSEIWLQEIQNEELYGHPVRFSNSQFVPIIWQRRGKRCSSQQFLASRQREYYCQLFNKMPEWDNVTRSELPEDLPPELIWRKRAIFFMAFICTGAFIALTWLGVVHGKQIVHGESSIEAHINKAERKRLAAQRKIHINPYDYGSFENWRIFFGINDGRSWLHVIFPSPHRPFGNGLSWQNIYHIRKTVEDKKIP